MAAIPYMPLYIADYLADAAHLSTVEHGAYLLLIMNYWQRGGPISSLSVRLASVARMSNDEWMQIQPTIAEFFTEHDGFWHHKRIEKELAHFRDKSEKSRAAGVASGERRRNVRSTPAERTINHTDTDTDTDTDTEDTYKTPAAPTVAEMKISGSLQTKRPSDETLNWFEAELWPIWVKATNDSKAAALKSARTKAKTLAIRGEILAGAKLQASERLSHDPQFRSHCSTWLNQERWKDCAIEPQPQTGQVSIGLVVNGQNGTVSAMTAREKARREELMRD